ncbi:MAG: hypothetical protein U1F09_16500 [Steroidobacteraceae bacterium]
MRTPAPSTSSACPRTSRRTSRSLGGAVLTNPFVNSGGARFFRASSAETVLLEDFAEGAEPPGGELLHALGLPARRGLARVQVDDLLARQRRRRARDLELDLLREFRLVCIRRISPLRPRSRLGRAPTSGPTSTATRCCATERSARSPAATSAGGLGDLVGLGLTDQRDGVVVRFAVIRRARHVARI